MKNTIEYLIADPAGNITILVCSAAERSDYAHIAKILLEHCPEAEQVGFIKAGQPLPTMEMCGLEFCGNASRAFAYYDIAKAGEVKGERTVCVSGSRFPLRAWADTDAGTAGIEMPLPQGTERMEIPVAEGTDTIMQGMLVHLEGISHLVIPKIPQDTDQEVLLPLFEQIRDHVYRVCERDMPAFGVMFLDEESCRMIPIVYVRDVETTYFEGSCASGTAAAGCALALGMGASGPGTPGEHAPGIPEEQAAGPHTYHYVLHQPAGDLEVTAERTASAVTHLSLQGSMSLSEVRSLDLNTI